MKNEKPNFRSFIIELEKQLKNNNFNTQELSEKIAKLFIQESEFIEFTRVNSDAYGNPRYVCHWSNLVTEKDRENNMYNYETALKRAKKLGGNKYNNKNYGGGIVFQSYNIEDEARRIKEMLNEYK